MNEYNEKGHEKASKWNDAQTSKQIACGIARRVETWTGMPLSGPGVPYRRWRRDADLPRRKRISIPLPTAEWPEFIQ